jgi:hypothetical protein
MAVVYHLGGVFGKRGAVKGSSCLATPTNLYRHHGITVRWSMCPTK